MTPDPAPAPAPVSPPAPAPVPPAAGGAAPVLRLDELVDLLATATLDEFVGAALGVPALVLSPVGASRTAAEQLTRSETLRSLPAVIVAEPDAPDWVVALTDVAAREAAEHDRLLHRVAARPVASTALVLLLRASGGRGVADGLVAESATYSTLQAGFEFAAWRSEHRPREREEPAGGPVVVRRVRDELHLELNRPHVSNALDARMRDAWCDALAVAVADRTVRRVVVSGRGRVFCAGGDLDEFGRRPDPATAHLVRLQRSPARAMAAIATRCECRIHGAAVGSGIELAAFARRVVAAPGTRIALPEIDLGLVPGAGGTVSLPKRIGRHRTALLALTGITIDAEEALGWGLVDEIAARA